MTGFCVNCGIKTHSESDVVFENKILCLKCAITLLKTNANIKLKEQILNVISEAYNAGTYYVEPVTTCRKCKKSQHQTYFNPHCYISKSLGIFKIDKGANFVCIDCIQNML